MHKHQSNSVIPDEAYRNQPIAGALFILGASFMFAMLGTLVKVVSTSLNNEMVVFFRNVCALIFILPWLAHSRPSGGIKTTCLRLHLLRSVAGLGAMYCFFYAIAHLRLSEAFLLASTSPLFIPLIAYVWMREEVTYSAKGAIIAGFIGIVLILKPGFGIFRPAMLVALATGVLVALAMVTIRRMSFSEPAMRIVFYFTIFSTVISAGPLFWSWQSPKPEIWWLLILIGLLAAVGQFFLTKGYSMAPAAQVGPLSYGNVVFATIIGWICWGETMDLLTWAGAFLVCMAGIITTRRTEAHVLVDAAVGKTPDP
ncbi:MAG: DMT family transporter [Desulfobacteraceae bacterium]|nr:DMT family transporter [Desulfobacteraceae bacterium]MDH3573051.1 DMT family transporter [Desulfobacteraceae bacterium]MDH3722253.1 DMT family transporter [Desulfobacteraceae bacterium]MDH3837810.1 DMT family transporter [Desulfobacteraceae bacterium]MDH3874345.1 DMT family transporter [Desulfobacteraceae bacterium]